MAYGDLTVDILKTHLRDRGLPISGVKVDLVTRLEADDKAKADLQRSQRVYNPQVNLEHLGGFSEAQLVDICKGSFLHLEDEPLLAQRQAHIEADYNMKYKSSYDKQNADIQKARSLEEKAKAKCEKEVKQAKQERDHELEKLGTDLEESKNKRRVFSRSLRELNALVTSRGDRPYKPADFNPRLSLRQSLPSQDFGQIAEHSTPTLKRKASPIRGPSTGKQNRGIELFPSIPTRPRTDRALNDREAIRPQLSHNSYIFISEQVIHVKEAWIARMETMVADADFAAKYVRADKTGYFIVFDASVQGDNQATRCFEHFRDRTFQGRVMEMKLCLRDSTNGPSSSA